MNRKQFLQSVGLLSLSAATMKLNALTKLTESFENTEQMPLLFLGHGSPMNAIQENEFTRGWKASVKNIHKPSAILCISAHWETKGTFVTAMEKPKTIHDFGGFPDELFAVQYPAPGSPELAEQVKSTVTKIDVGLDMSWGLDHGAWSVIKQLYPTADIPVIQMSLDYNQPPHYHYELAKELASLRKKGVLIIGSGNIVHNLGIIDWNNPTGGYDWAEAANTKLKKLISTNNHKGLINYTSLGKELILSVPTPEHYLPLLYILGLKEEKEAVSFFNDKTVMGSIAMTSLKIG